MGDPRLYQIGTLASLLVYGMGWVDFDITAGARRSHPRNRARHAVGLRPAVRAADRFTSPPAAR